MTTVKITRDQIDTILATAGSHFLSVEFEKLNGEIRHLNGHLKVVKYLAGGESTIAGHEDLVSIFDNAKKAYRCFSKDRLKRMKVNGNEYVIADSM